MKRVGVRELENGLSRYSKEASQDETIEAGQEVPSKVVFVTPAWRELC